jgi:hypothetical protein
MESLSRLSYKERDMAMAPFRMESLDELPPEVDRLFRLHEVDERVQGMAIRDYEKLCAIHDRRTRDQRAVGWAVQDLANGRLYPPNNFAGEVHAVGWDGVCERQLWEELCEWGSQAPMELQKRGSDAMKTDLERHLTAHGGVFAGGKQRALSKEERDSIDAGTHLGVKLGSKFVVPSEKYHIPLEVWGSLEVREREVVALYWLIQLSQPNALAAHSTHLNCRLAEQMVAAFEGWASRFNQRRNSIESQRDLTPALRALFHLAERDEKSPWSVESVPLCCDLAVLRWLDTKGYIEFRYLTRYASMNGALQSSEWFSPTASPVIAGSVSQIMVSANRSENIPCEVRVTEVGRATISELEFERKTSTTMGTGRRNPARAVSREEARQLAEQYVRQSNNRYPGFNSLASAIGVSKGGLQNAIADSSYLQAIIKEFKKAQALKGGSVRATVPVRESDVDTRVRQTTTEAERDRLLGGLADDALAVLQDHPNRVEITEMVMSDPDRRSRGNTGGPKVGRPKPVTGGRSDFSAKNGKSR